MNVKPWGGVFREGPSRKTEEFTAKEDVKLDERLIPYDILCNKAHVLMLFKQGVLSRDVVSSILKALEELEEA